MDIFHGIVTQYVVTEDWRLLPTAPDMHGQRGSVYHPLAQPDNRRTTLQADPQLGRLGCCGRLEKWFITDTSHWQLERLEKWLHCSCSCEL